MLVIIIFYCQNLKQHTIIIIEFSLKTFLFKKHF